MDAPISGIENQGGIGIMYNYDKSNDDDNASISSDSDSDSDSNSSSSSSSNISIMSSNKSDTGFRSGHDDDDDNNNRTPLHPQETLLPNSFEYKKDIRDRIPPSGMPLVATMVPKIIRCDRSPLGSEWAPVRGGWDSPEREGCRGTADCACGYIECRGEKTACPRSRGGTNKKEVDIDRLGEMLLKVFERFQSDKYCNDNHDIHQNCNDSRSSHRNHKKKKKWRHRCRSEFGSGSNAESGSESGSDTSCSGSSECGSSGNGSGSSSSESDTKTKYKRYHHRYRNDHHHHRHHHDRTYRDYDCKGTKKRHKRHSRQDRLQTKNHAPRNQSCVYPSIKTTVRRGQNGAITVVRQQGLRVEACHGTDEIPGRIRDVVGALESDDIGNGEHYIPTTRELDFTACDFLTDRNGLGDAPVRGTGQALADNPFETFDTTAGLEKTYVPGAGIVWVRAIGVDEPRPRRGTFLPDDDEGNDDRVPVNNRIFLEWTGGKEMLDRAVRARERKMYIESGEGACDPDMRPERPVPLTEQERVMLRAQMAVDRMLPRVPKPAKIGQIDEREITASARGQRSEVSLMSQKTRALSSSLLCGRREIESSLWVPIDEARVALTHDF